MKSNPMIRKGMAEAQAIPGEKTMTVAGARNKTLLLLVLLAVSFVGTFFALPAGSTLSSGLMVTAMIGAMVLAFTTIFKPHLASKTAPAYAIVEGVLVGSMSHVMNQIVPGIVVYAVTLTLLVVLFTLVLYKHSPEIGMKIRRGVMIATLAVFGVMFISMIFNMFGASSLYATLYGYGPVGIGFGLLIVGIAAANLIVDYDNIYQGAQHGFPEHFEWFFAFGIMVTVIWLYMEIMRLLLRFAARND